MKLVFVCNEYPPKAHGGIGTFTHTIAHGLKLAGHSVTVVGLDEHAAERDDDGVRVVTLKTRSQPPYVSWLADRVTLFRWLRLEAVTGRCDLIELPDYQGLLPFPFAACPVVIRLHLSGTAISRAEDVRTPPGVFVGELLTHYCHRNWIAVSDHARRLTVATFGLKPVETSTIYNPIALTAAEVPAPSDLPARFVLFAGSVDARKGAFTVAAAARLFLPLFPDLQVLFLGDTPVEDGIRSDDRIRAIVGPEFAARVHCRGRVDRPTVLACMRRSSVFVFPSTLENNPLVVGEAMLSDVPVVTSTCDPFPEYLTDNETALLVPPDDPAALSAAVRRVLDSPDLARRLTAAGRRLAAEKFGLPQCVESSERFYRQVVAARRDRPVRRAVSRT